MTDISQPHDAFFKEVFSRKETAADFRHVPWDASRYSEKEIKGGVIARAALLAFN